ncbi:lipopolysaccharide assembly protein LapB [Bacteriovorax sp. Seq25_V]|uniref:tetratricopeptide repeat protein n=1 Tax=Bacteriovorax sp. Seq25_V TaxID=1201288 RepID=UPI00038A0D6B|nr:hypothetical protein [Bacteriovorax sp. Seq25_V]EQC44819.1 hypothetical protein M900_0332 [Bacteriovorax sp. Seq25_V]
MKFLQVIILLVLTLTVSASDDRNAKIISVIDMELSELSRMSRVSNNRDPEILLRIAELYLEKARVIRDSENQSFFSKSLEERRNINKKKFYGQSQSYFSKAQETGLFILKRFKNFKGIGDVYYILAFNEKENQNMKKSKALFVNAIKRTKTGSPANIKSRLALGDIYYSEGDFKRAKGYYDSVIRQIRDDKWYTRYLYNLSWSNFRVNNKKTAISQMKTVFELSKNSKFVDKGEAAQRDLGYFYADSGNVKAASSFYKTIGGDLSKNFYEMGMQLKDKQKYSESLNMFKSAFNGTGDEYKIKSLLELLSIYDKYNRNDAFVQYANEVVKLKEKLSAEQTKEALFYITKRAALLQKELGLSHNKSRPSVMKEKSGQTKDLYYAAKAIDPKLTEQSHFYAAEALYAANDFDNALVEYDAVRSIGNESSKFYQRSLVGMLIAINAKGVKKVTREKYFEKIYLDYIKLESNIDKKGKAVEKLFSYLIDEKGDVKGAMQVFFQYVKIFPKNINKNEAMIGRIVDLHKKQNNREELFSFVEQLKTLNVPLRRGFVDGLNKIVLLTQFENVQKANSKGDKVYALKGYLTIYQEKSTSAEAKRNAAYNIAVLFYESGNMKLMSQWAQRAISEMTVSEVTKYMDSFSLMTKELYLRQRFDEGLKVTEDILNKTCSVKNSQKYELINNYLIMGIASGKEPSLTNYLRSTEKCSIDNKTRSMIAGQLFDYYIEVKAIEQAVAMYYQLDKYSNDSTVLTRNLGSLLMLFEERGSTGPSDLVKRFYANYKRVKNKSLIGVDGFDFYALQEIKSVKRLADSISSIKLVFPVDKYNQLLKKKLGMLNQLTGLAARVLAVGSGEGTVQTYEILIKAYTDIATEIENFVPDNKEPEFLASFKKGMAPLITPLKGKAFEFEKELAEQVLKNEVLSKTYGARARNSVDFYHDNESVLMDKRGL